MKFSIVAVFSFYLVENVNGYESALSPFSPKLSETSFTTRDHDYLEWVLRLYRKTLDKVIATIGDRAQVNKSPSNLSEKPIIRCASHRFKLAACKFWKDQVKSPQKFLKRWLKFAY